MVADMTATAVRLCLENFLILTDVADGPLPADVLAKLHPRILSSNPVETFFSVVRSTDRTFNVCQFATTFTKHLQIMAVKEAGFHVTGFHPNAMKRTNYYTRYFCSTLFTSVCILIIYKFCYSGRFQGDAHNSTMTAAEGAAMLVHPGRRAKGAALLPEEKEAATVAAKLLKDRIAAVKEAVFAMEPALKTKKGTVSIRTSQHRASSCTSSGKVACPFLGCPSLKTYANVNSTALAKCFHGHFPVGQAGLSKQLLGKYRKGLIMAPVSAASVEVAAGAAVVAVVADAEAAADEELEADLEEDVDEHSWACAVCPLVEEGLAMIFCDNCKKWFHQDCILASDEVFTYLEAAPRYICTQCILSV